MLSFLRKVLGAVVKLGVLIFNVGRLVESRSKPAEESYTLLETENGVIKSVETSLDTNFVCIEWDKVNEGDHVAAVKYIERMKATIKTLPKHMVDNLSAVLDDALVLRQAQEGLF